MAGPATSLPHAVTIQWLFGGHDLSSVQAHVGGPAAGACDAMGASAFASGSHVAFAAEPDLHTVAHEAAHVVQQAQGVQLYSGVSSAGDAYERHADAVANRVVAGRSAADLLGHRARPASAARRASSASCQHSGSQLEQWHSVHFIGDVFERQDSPAAKRTNTDAGPELDLMNVRRAKNGLHCLAVGNVKVGKTRMAGAANQQNADALALLRSFSSDSRVQLASGDWAHVKQITAEDVPTGAAVAAITRPFTIEGSVATVTIGAASAPGDYTKRLAYTADQVTAIAHCLQALGSPQKDH